MPAIRYEKGDDGIVVLTMDAPDASANTLNEPFIRSLSEAIDRVEGEKDDISGVGQTEAAHRLCVNIPPERKAHYLQPGVGHYGVFNGSRFRSEIAPRIADFIVSNNGKTGVNGVRAGRAVAAAAAAVSAKRKRSRRVKA